MKQKDFHGKHCWFTGKSILALLLLIVLSGVVLAQERSITGIVTDNGRSPLPGVNVVVKGTTTGTVTDLNGKFSVKVPGNSSVLIITYVGYVTKEIEAGQQNSIEVALSEDVKQLNEVVVIGYGVQKKSDLTGAVASVKAEEIVKIPSATIDAALQGMAAGVQVNQETGAPGSNVEIRIRGISSLNGGTPLWVIDGIPGGDISTVNTNDIESIEILKDGASAAIYGANGGNGVILVTTKRGKEGKPMVEVNYYHGYQYVPKRLDMATGPEYEKTFTEQEALQGKHTFRYPNWQSAPTYNYQDMIFQVAPMDNLDFNVSGGNEKLKAFLGVGYINQEGIFKSSSYQRFNFRLNSDFKVSDWFKIGEKMGFNNSITSGLPN